LDHGVKQQRRERRGPKTYTGEVTSALVKIWEICDHICSKRLQPLLPEIVGVLEQERELVLPEQTKRLLLQMSPATMDRCLQRVRHQRRRGWSTTKPGTLLKQAIPVRTFTDWDNARPGFVEMDLVAHCGDSTHGEYLNTLNVVDMSTGWSECLVWANRSQHQVSAAIRMVSISSCVGGSAGRTRVTGLGKRLRRRGMGYSLPESVLSPAQSKVEGKAEGLGEGLVGRANGQVRRLLRSLQSLAMTGCAAFTDGSGIYPPQQGRLYRNSGACLPGAILV
jgi:hypothetical protein